MKIKILIILLFILIMLAFGFLVFNQFYPQEDHILVGDVNFTLPPGFHEGTINSIGDVNITNGTHTLFIAYYNDNNITKYVQMYTNGSNQTNYTYSISNFTIDDIFVCKAVNDQGGAEHFWFVKNNHVYSVYDWEKYDDIDRIFFDLIKSSDY